MGCLFTFLMVIFEVQKFSILMKSNLSFFSFVDLAFLMLFPTQCTKIFFLCFLLKLIILALTLRIKFIFLLVASQLLQHHLFKRLSFFSIKLPWCLYRKSMDHKCKNLFLDSHFCSIDTYVSLFHRFNITSQDPSDYGGKKTQCVQYWNINE